MAPCPPSVPSDAATPGQTLRNGQCRAPDQAVPQSSLTSGCLRFAHRVAAALAFHVPASHPHLGQIARSVLNDAFYSRNVTHITQPTRAPRPLRAQVAALHVGAVTCSRASSSTGKAAWLARADLEIVTPNRAVSSILTMFPLDPAAQIRRRAGCSTPVRARAHLDGDPPFGQNPGHGSAARALLQVAAGARDLVWRSACSRPARRRHSDAST